MPDKEASQSAAGAGIDLPALELEIDREIDALFVPAEQGAEGADKEVEARDSSQSHPVRKEAESARERKEGIDFDALQVEIDKEIDNLFIPTDGPQHDVGPVQAGNRQSETVGNESPASFDGSLPVSPKRGGPSAKPFEVSANAKYEEASPLSDSHKFHLNELTGLIEIFNASYLSLDWEFSRENIQKFLAILNQLEPFASRHPDVKSVFKIMEAILKRLVDRPGGVNSTLVQLIRDSHGLLAHILLMEGEMGQHEKQRLKDLVERFQELRRRALQIKAEARTSGLADKSGLSPSKNLEIIYAELTRLQQVETILRRTPAFVDMAERLNGIGSTIKNHADLLRGIREDLQSQRSKGVETVAASAIALENRGTPVVNSSMSARRENLFLISLCGKSMALPASCVLRVARSTGKKGFKILKRGYATLGDFMPPFRGIKRGIIGEWTKLPAKELKSYRFEPLEPLPLDQAMTSGSIAVLVSDGQTHRIIFCQMVNFLADAEVGAGPQPDGTPGPFVSNLRLLVPVFDPRSPLFGKGQCELTTDER